MLRPTQPCPLTKLLAPNEEANYCLEARYTKGRAVSSGPRSWQVTTEGATAPETQVPVLFDVSALEYTAVTTGTTNRRQRVAPVAMASLSGSATDVQMPHYGHWCIFGDRGENLLKNKRTALFDFHSAHGARIVSFAGWDMPVHYRDGIKAEHLRPAQRRPVRCIAHGLARDNRYRRG